MGTVHNNNSTGKRAIIVGATSGIGYEVAKILYSEGWIIGLWQEEEKKI